jgi:hypothetical protein
MVSRSRATRQPFLAAPFLAAPSLVLRMLTSRSRRNVATLDRRGREPPRDSVPRPPFRRTEAAFVVAIVTALVIWWVWGALQPVPVVQDEYSYVLQAKIFASGHWTAPSPPVPSSFQQPHVLTVPRVASKYAPGHAFVLALGALVGAPWLVPLVLSAITGALVFLLIERFTGPWIALAGWAIWLTDPINLSFRPGYYSELTSGALWLVSWWLLLEWRESKRLKALLLLAAAIGLGAITRPLSMLAFAIPVGIYVIRQVASKRRWRDLGLAVLVGIGFLAILPLWSAKTTGSVTDTPLALYRRQYLPFDHTGFGLDSTRATFPLSPDNADVYAEFAPEHVDHTFQHLPPIVATRLATIARQEWPGWRIAVIPLCLLGATLALVELWFAAACAFALFVAYIFYAHHAAWTLYYFEGLPVLAFFAAAGLVRLAQWTVRWRTPMLDRGLIAAAACALLVAAPRTLLTWRRGHIELARYDTAFQRLVAQLPFRGSVIFVRYALDMHPHTNIVTNSATLATDRTWVVIDDPAKNLQLLRAAAGRVPLLFEEQGARIRVYRELVDSLATDGQGGTRSTTDDTGRSGR